MKMRLTKRLERDEGEDHQQRGSGNNGAAAIRIPSQRAPASIRVHSERPLGAGLQPRQDDQEDEGVDKQADRQCIRTDPDGPLSEALTGCNQE